MAGLFLGGVCLLVLGVLGVRVAPEIGRHRRLLMALGAVLVVASVVPGMTRGFYAGYETGRRIRQGQLAAGRGSPGSGRTAPRCSLGGDGLREGKQPRQVLRVKPDLSGLVTIPAGVVIVEIRIDETGRVTDDCLLVGVRADVDRRVLDAVRRWRYEPTRLKSATADGRLPAGAPVPLFMTVTVTVGPGDERER